MIHSAVLSVAVALVQTLAHMQHVGAVATGSGRNFHSRGRNLHSRGQNASYTIAQNFTGSGLLVFLFLRMAKHR